MGILQDLIGDVNINIQDLPDTTNTVSVSGYVFGGGKGNSSTAAVVSGNIVINVDGCNLSNCSVFGGSNINGTIDGFEKIKDLKLGDKVLDENDEETTIEKVYGHIIYNPYVITLDNNETIVCSHDHKFKTQNGIKTADSLTLKDTLYDYRIVNISVENKEQNVYEIRTTSGNYRLANGIVCECEVI